MRDPRSVALECVLAVQRDDAYANLVLPGLIGKAHLDRRDAALATELSYGTLRMRGLYDAVIARAARRDPATLDLTVRACLWMGAHQALAMRVPAHAAVSETVRLVKSTGAERASGLVNAVMRRITEATIEAWIARVAPGAGRADMAVRYSHPEWVVRELDASLRADGRAGQLVDVLAADNVPAHVTMVARPGLIDRAELARVTGGRPTRLSPYGVTLASGDPGAVAAVKEGRAAVQDEGSQLAAAVLAVAPLAGTDRSWLDMCAGPGGKAALLAALAAERGAHVDALELHPHRAELVRAAVAALPPKDIAVHVADALEWAQGPYDRILLDAPCTGLGALRRRPESRWRKSEDDLADLAALQLRLLHKAASLVRSGGIIAYVTCSPVLAETREVVASGGLALLDARPVLASVAGGNAADFGNEPAVQLWTHAHGTDGMFIALLKAE